MNKQFHIYILLLLLPILSFAQNYDLSGMHGLPDGTGNLIFELGGYNIFISDTKGQKADAKTINALKKKFNMKTALAEYRDYRSGREFKVIEAEFETKDKSDINGSTVCYLFDKTKEDITYILFKTHNQRDIVLEQEVVDEYLKNGLSAYIDVWAADSIAFAGRTIHLGSACKWMSPHNIHCMGGQISWSEFPSFMSANLDANNRIAANASNKDITILDEGDIDIIFEDIPSVAHRVVYLTKTGVDSGNPLIVYYVVQEVRGRYISCVLSNYGYNRNDFELSPLLQQVMSIPELPETAFNPFDIPEPEYDTAIEEEKTVRKINMFEVRAGAWLPIGNLQNTFKIAPSIGLFAGFPIKADMAIDLGVQIAFPINSNRFDFYYRRAFYDEAKISAIGNISVRWRYQKEMAPNVYWTPYIGFGLNALTTDLEKDNYDDDTDKWHSIETIGVFGGVSLRYKKVGCFLEYHYAPYSIAGKARKNFGSSAINVGASFAF